MGSKRGLLYPVQEQELSLIEAYQRKCGNFTFPVDIHSGRSRASHYLFHWFTEKMISHFPYIKRKKLKLYCLILMTQLCFNIWEHIFLLYKFTVREENNFFIIHMLTLEICPLTTCSHESCLFVCLFPVFGLFFFFFHFFIFLLPLMGINNLMLFFIPLQGIWLGCLK